jgi:pyruvate,water dikinase
LRAEPGAAAFVNAFDALIARHGRRSQGWDLTNETWRERPEAALALVRAQLGAERTSPAEVAASSAAKREQARDRVLSVLPAGKQAEFRGMVDLLDNYVTVREGRAYWQMVISGSVRGVLLRTGAALVKRGRIDEASDIFFLHREDIEGGAGDLRPTVQERRAEWQRLHTVKAQSVIGTPGDNAAAAEARRADMRGMAASRGKVTGTARILQSPEEGSRLAPGEILVCVMTTPAWTPLFAIAGGIITESGGALSHPAITAREYGIPAVVALEGATTRIKDGQTVTIDGGTGRVSFLA